MNEPRTRNEDQIVAEVLTTHPEYGDALREMLATERISGLSAGLLGVELSDWIPPISLSPNVRSLISRCHALHEQSERESGVTLARQDLIRPPEITIHHQTSDKIRVSLSTDPIDSRGIDAFMSALNILTGHSPRLTAFVLEGEKAVTPSTSPCIYNLCHEVAKELGVRVFQPFRNRTHPIVIKAILASPEIGSLSLTQEQVLGTLIVAAASGSSIGSNINIPEGIEQIRQLRLFSLPLEEYYQGVLNAQEMEYNDPRFVAMRRALRPNPRSSEVILNHETLSRLRSLDLPDSLIVGVLVMIVAPSAPMPDVVKFAFRAHQGWEGGITMESIHNGILSVIRGRLPRSVTADNGDSLYRAVREVEDRMSKRMFAQIAASESNNSAILYVTRRDVTTLLPREFRI